MQTTIGVDLGGTKIKAGIQKNGVITELNYTLLKEKHSQSKTIKQLIDFIAPLAKQDVDGIGIGVPSVVDVEKGIVYNVVNIPSWKKVLLKEILESEFHLPVYVNNDANCFALGEYFFGLAKAYSHVVGLSIGTGLGAGIILNNELVNGSNCGAGEIGYLPYLDRDLEHYASGNFFHSCHNISALEAHELAINGDKPALKMWEEFGIHLGNAIKAVMYVYDPQIIVLGGSIAKAFGYFKTAMYSAMADFIYPESLRKIKIAPSENEDITLLGASSLVTSKNNVSALEKASKTASTFPLEKP